ncbi:putative OsmC-like protein [Evansella vedderi]|uniref:OsmC-like protein n=1 Tax=Evansella vedderi TaxID=38282 RepID=A0ABT9ZVK0_9BACI|nr:OsmC family protein [Evansella vedderi]MDQ0255272.1 putative OsmC-like protein [Evansella vedderi]
MSTQFTVSITGKSEGMKTEVAAGKHTLVLDEPESMGGKDAGADPLSTLLAALVSCKNVVINLVAKEMEFNLRGVEFKTDGNLDLRGLMGDPSVRTYFETVSLRVVLDTDEPAERIEELQIKSEARCPVFQTLKAANVELSTEWTKA